MNESELRRQIEAVRRGTLPRRRFRLGHDLTSVHNWYRDG